ncbi:protein mono-ADP-ribosyltransferase PARP15-like [Gigantopelta aegis]|uniref:protein mono-ADP-ribosyltransferase PARP15-like n=1 Tax=Gigantopelta aegis TaxID=1735272 RepID=UPI001B88904E|nr:protein mono-ADP-ribosyltransferase PARP15-like [Gigantopelta aegis]
MASAEDLELITFTPPYMCDDSTPAVFKRYAIKELIDTIWHYHEFHPKTSLKKVAIVINPGDMLTYKAASEILHVLGLEESPEVINKLDKQAFTKPENAETKESSNLTDASGTESVAASAPETGVNTVGWTLEAPPRDNTKQRKPVPLPRKYLQPNRNSAPERLFSIDSRKGEMSTFKTENVETTETPNLTEASEMKPISASVSETNVKTGEDTHHKSNKRIPVPTQRKSLTRNSAPEGLPAIHVGQGLPTLVSEDRVTATPESINKKDLPLAAYATETSEDSRDLLRLQVPDLKQQNSPTLTSTAQVSAPENKSTLTPDPSKLDTSGKLQHMNILLIAGDITEERVDAIVNSTNRKLDFSVGLISRAIAEAGGVSLKRAIEEYKRESSKDPTTQITVTDAGDLPCSKIFHVCLPLWPPSEQSENQSHCEQKLCEIIEMCLICASVRGMHSIAFPLLGAGTLKYPSDVVARAFVETIWSFRVIHRETSLQLVKIIVGISNTEFRQNFAQLRSRKATYTRQDKNHEMKTLQFSGQESRNENSDNQIQIGFVRGQLEKQSIHALVIPCSSDLKPNTSVGKAVHEAAGAVIRCELREHCTAPLKDWAFVVTSGGNLEAKYIYHVNIPRYSPDAVTKQQFPEMLNRCLTDACLINCKGIAFTVPVSKELKYLPKLMAEWFKRGFDRFQRSHSHLLFFEMRVVIKENDKATYDAFQEVQFGTETIDFNQVPRTWGAMSKDAEVVAVSLHQHDTEYKEVAQLLKETASIDFRIKKIERIQNRALYLQYNVKRWQLSHRHTEHESIERRLWHGTTEDAVRSINYHGFNRSYCGKNGSTREEIRKPAYLLPSIETIHSKSTTRQ